MSDPWADPATATQAGPPYAGPPPTVPPYVPPYGYGAPPYGYAGPPYGYAAPYVPYAPYAQWPPGPPSPWAAGGREWPGQVIAAAVLAFVQATVVLVASLYLWFFASVADLAASVAVRGGYASPAVRGLATEGSTLTAVQLASVVLLVAAGVLALNRRTGAVRLWLIAAHAGQVLLAGYWTLRLLMLLDAIPGDDAQWPVLLVTLFFALGPAAALGMLVAGPGRRWFDGTTRT